MQLLTHSRMAVYRDCHRKYYLRHVRGLTPVAERHFRRRGSAFGLAILAVGQDDQDIPMRKIIEKSVQDSYKDEHPANTAEAEAMAVEAVRVYVMAEAYIDRYGIDQRREVEYDLPLINPYTNQPSMEWRRAGKIDGVITLGSRRWNDEEYLWARIVEDKFTSSIQKVMIDRLPLDQQTTEYVDAFLQMGWRAEVAYRHTRVPGIEPLKAKTYKTKPDLPAESLEEYAERLREDVAERPSFYFDEQILYYPDEHMEDYRRGRWHLSREIIDREDTESIDNWWMNTSKCADFGGCDFIPLCCQWEGAINLYRVEEPDIELSEETHGATTAGQ